MMPTAENWTDLYGRLKNAENELEELADATNDPNEASRLMSKMHGVSLARDYMRGYFDPTSDHAAAPNGPVEPEPTMPMDWADRMVYFVSLLLTTPDLTLLRNEQEDWEELLAEWRITKSEDMSPVQDAFPTITAPRGGIKYPDPATHTKSVWKFVINPFTTTEMPRGAEILYVGEQGNDVCVWALVDPGVAINEERSINAYGTGHTVPTSPGRYLGSVQMRNGHNAGLVFHLFDGDDV